MRNIYKHDQAIHLAHNLFTEIRETVVKLFATACVCPIVRVVPCQGHVTHAQTIKVAQDRERVFYYVPAFYAHQRGNLSTSFGETNVACGSRQHKLVRMPLDRSVNSVNHVHCSA